MNRLVYIFGIAVGLLSLNSCREPEVEDPDPVIEYGELKADFKVVNIEGEETSNFDIGDKIFLIDVSEGRPDSRQWDVPGAIPNASDNRNFTVAYPRSGEYSVGLSVQRSHDAKSDSIEKSNVIKVNWIPVEADFSTDVPTVRGKCNIKLGDYVTFYDQSSGMPDDRNWSFEGGKPGTYEGTSAKVQFRELGSYSVDLLVTRDDGDEIVSDTKTRSNFIVVEERNIEVQLATYSEGVAKLTFSDPLTITDAAALRTDIQATAKNGENTFPLSVGSVKVADNDIYSLELEVEGDIYEDDELILSMESTSSLYDTTMLTLASPFNTPCDVVGFENGNILDPDYVGFELPHAAVNFAYCADYYIAQNAEDIYFMRTTDKSYAGNASMRFLHEVPKTGNTGQPLYGMLFTDYSKGYYLPEGEYMLYQPVFIEKESDIKSMTFIIAERLDWSPYVEFEWDMSELPRGRWVVMRQKISIEKDLGTVSGDRSAGTRSTYRVDGTPNEGVEGDQIFYLDGMSMVPLTNARPQ